MRTTAAALALVTALTAACSAEEPSETDATPTPVVPSFPKTSGAVSAWPPGPAAWVDALPTGAPPRIGYAIGHTYHRPDGQVVRLPRDFGITSIVRLGEGYLVTSDHSFEGTTGVFRLDEDGRIDTSAGQRGHVAGAATLASHPVLGTGGATVHWLTFTPPESGLRLPTLLHTGNVESGEVIADEVDVDYVSLAYVVGVVADGVVIRAGWAGHGDVLTYDTSSRELIRSQWLHDVGLIHTRTGRATVARGKDQSALGVVDLASREQLWLRRHSYPIAFSPSGRSLLLGSGRSVAVLDARTGDVRREFERPGYRRGRWSGEFTWEDDQHLLASVKLRRRVAVVRIDVETGAVELAVDWTPNDGTYYAAFETRP